MSKLKPCPFCGSEARTIQHSVDCSNTKCELFSMDFTKYEWNIRPIEDKLQAELETVRAVAEIKDPEQHFEQIMAANKRLQAELDKTKSYIKQEQSLSDDFARRYKAQAAEVERLKEGLRLLKQRIDDPAWLISDNVKQIERLLKGQDNDN